MTPTAAAPTQSMFGRPARAYPDRWRLGRAGIVNVWHYLDNEFDVSGGRMILRGTNGSGKSRALEMLLPFLLDGDRRKMDATGSGKVNLDELMRTGADDQTNRSGYLWAEFERPGEYLTVGALLRFSRSANRTQVWYFTTGLRVGRELPLLSPNRSVLTREALGELIGVEHMTESAEAHRDRIRGDVFGLHGDAGRDRFAGLLQLLHTLRSPDVGNRIDEGRLPQILSDSLPPLRENTLTSAGDSLDGLTETRLAQQRLENSHQQVQRLMGVYGRYAAGVLLDTAAGTHEVVERYVEGELRVVTTAADHERLQQELVDKKIVQQDLADQLKEIRKAIDGIRGREIFKTTDDLAQRDKAVEALAKAADSALSAAAAARRHHRQAVENADGRLREVSDQVDRAARELAATRGALVAALLPDGGLPDSIRGVVDPGQHPPVSLRTDRDGPPVAVDRPRPGQIDVWPTDLDAPQAAPRASGEAALRRRELAERHLSEAVRLENELNQVVRLEDDAAQAQDTAETDAEAAVTAAQARDDSAVELATGWRSWTADPTTTDLLGPIDWAGTSVWPLLLDVDTLGGPSTTDLDALDLAAAEQSVPTRNAIAERRQELATAQRQEQAERKALQAEQTELRAARDPAPADAPWLAPDRIGVPLWRAVDFAESLSQTERAGLEAALLASGLLTATIEVDGRVRAETGQLLLLLPGATPAGRPLSLVLRPDPGAALPGALMSAVLDGIGLDDDLASTSVSLDGSWHHGQLHGRHSVDEARHIGAEARARRRDARLAEIDRALELLDVSAAARATIVEQLELRERRLAAHLRTAPTSKVLFAARSASRQADERAAHSLRRAEESTKRARVRRDQWAADHGLHRTACSHFDLPVESQALRDVVDATKTAARHCADLLKAVAQLADRVVRHQQALLTEATSRDERDGVEQAAAQQWDSWMEAASELAAQHEAIALDVKQAKEELKRSEATQREVEGLATAATQAVNLLGPAIGRADADGRQAGDAVGTLRATMIAAAELLSRRLTLPGLLAAVTDLPVPLIERPDQAESVRGTVEQLRSIVRRPSQGAGENTVLNAFQVFDREVSGQLDTSDSIADGVHQIQVAGAGDDHTLAGAAAHLARQVQDGRAALSDREREVFTKFVLGGVAEELRRQVNQARTLIAAMNSSLKEIRTSNGIGVRIGWRLADDAAGLARVLQLVATSDAVRTAAQSEELTDLLRRRVEDSYAADPTSGYAVHLAGALDYRLWHEIEVVILGPAPGQERRISKRAKLSQGETRFVSYVTLFAAADGYLSGLPHTDRSLRLILLDDAFAKVDDPTIAELMGLLVHLDLDFVMTGHALWGCFPQVPKLDVYEVRRLEGSSAVTTHVHWDGRNRHLRPSA